MKLLSLLKLIPVDLGQGSWRHITKGKIIAFSFVGDGNGKRALDLGAGDCYWSYKLSKKGWQVTSADKEKGCDKSIFIDAERPLPFAEKSFDLVWCSEVIEHIANLDSLISEIQRITKPGGLIIITTPNSYFWLYRCLSIFGLTPKKLQNPDHKRFFSMKDVKRLFPKADILGYFPYFILKLKIKNFISLLSPTFVIIEMARKDND